MKFTPLPQNNFRTRKNHLYLLKNMENKQFKNAAAFQKQQYSTNHAQPAKPRFKYITKANISNPTIPFYQGSTFRKPLTHTYQRKASKPEPHPNAVKLPPPIPHLVNPSHSKKLLHMSKNIQSGSIVEANRDVESIFFAAKWDKLIYLPKHRYFVHLLGEFYCNMRPIRGLNGIMHLTSIVGGKPILVDHKTINIALRLPHQVIACPCIDIYERFVFDKNEFELMVGFFTDSDVPSGLCDTNFGIHYKHFTSIYQLVALVMRANVIPKPNQDKYFDFYELKIMFLLVTNKVDFSVSYLILLNMINSQLAEYMPYGNLLTSVFDVYHIPTPDEIAVQCTSCISLKHIRSQISLDKCEREPASLLRFPSYMAEEDVFLADNRSVVKLFEEQKVEMCKLRNMVTHLENMALVDINEPLDNEVDIGAMYQVQMEREGALINEIDNLHRIEAVGTGLNSQDSAKET